VEAMPAAPAWWSTGPLLFTVIARGGTLTLADASFVAGELPRGAPFSDVEAACETFEAQDAGLLLAWKSW
ncbi:MAG: glycosyltransferase family 32 protein, partial [Shinella sp.]